MAFEAPPLTAEDEALLERVAARVVELHMEVVAILTLESSRPVSVIAGQAMIFFEPIAQALFRFPEYRRFAALIERRDTIEALVRRIEDGAERRRRADRSPAPGDRTRG